MGSIAMDRAGNIALGYSVSSVNTFPSIRYAVRENGDAAGMLRPEASLIEGGGVQLGGFNRWGDYSAMSVDPVDDCTFWYTNQYYESSSQLDWQTRVGSFEIPSCQTAPEPPVPDPAPFVVAIVDLEVTKTGPGGVEVGNEIDYVITVTNSSGDTAPEVALLDMFLDDRQTSPFSFVSSVEILSIPGECTRNPFSANTIDCDLGDMPPNSSATLTITVRVAPWAEGTLENTASVTANAFDPDLTNNAVSVTTNLIRPPDAPIAFDDSYFAPSSGLTVVPAPGVLGNDFADSPALRAWLLEPAQLGPINFFQDGSFRYESFFVFEDAIDRFSYYATDNEGRASTETWVSIVLTDALVCGGELATVFIDPPSPQPKHLATLVAPIGFTQGWIIIGTPSRDVIVGSEFADVILGLAGDDLICARGGDDIVDAGGGNDVVLAGDGNDTVRGGLGDDRLHGQKGDDTLLGGAGMDTIYGGPGRDILSGDRGQDRLSGGPGNDVHLGRGGPDSILCGSGFDIAFGGLGVDTFAQNCNIRIE